MIIPEGPLINKCAGGKTAETNAIRKVTRDGILADVVLTALYHILAFDSASAVKMKQLVSAIQEVKKACGYKTKIYEKGQSDLCNRPMTRDGFFQDGQC